jgi:diguanylate cyclase (GGDEF)-like protein
MNAINQTIPWKSLLAFVGLYLLFSYISIALMTAPGHVTLFWPASGVALTYLARYGLKWAIPLGLTVWLMHWLMNPVPSLFLFYSILSNVVGASLAAYYIRSHKIQSFLSMQSGFTILRAGILMAISSGLIGVTGLCLSDMASFSNFWPEFARWGMGNLLGTISTAPTIFLLTSPQSKNPDHPIQSDYASTRSNLLWLITMLVAFVLVYFGGLTKSPYAIGLTGLPVALMIWSAIRFQPIWTTVGTGLTVITMTAMIGFGFASFIQPYNLIDVVFLIIFLGLIAILPLTLMSSTHEHRISIRKNFRRATTDPETGLPNRTAFEETSRNLLNDIGPTRTLAYLDFDHFNLVNDTTSHEAGDVLIKGIASMLQSNLYPNDKIFRIGGDEFAIIFLCEGYEATTRAQIVLNTIESFKIGWGEHILSTTASIGLTLLNPGKSNYSQLLSAADAACFTAKELGGNRICLSETDNTELNNQTDVMRSAILIRNALDKNYFELVCQDIKSLSDSSIAGRYFEVLLRMRDQDTGTLLSPKSFIPAAERFNLGVKIDCHVIDQLLTWMETNPQHAKTVRACSVNLSGASMSDESFSNFLHNRLKKSSFPPHKIIFEITETCAMQDLTKAQTLIFNLKQIGCRFALDDFGAGFCSFSYLQNLDVDIFKIDGSFIRNLESSELSKAVIRSITDIAHVLNKTTVAEHCETLESIDLLRQLGVDQAQGFAIHQPQAIAEYFKNV